MWFTYLDKYALLYSYILENRERCRFLGHDSLVCELLTLLFKPQISDVWQMKRPQLKRAVRQALGMTKKKGGQQF